MQQYIDKFCDYLSFERRLSTHTIKAYKKDLVQLKSFLLEYYECQELRNINSNMFRTWIVQFVDQGLANSSINRKIAAARSFGRFVLREEYLEMNPFEQVKSLRKEQRIPAFANEQQLQKVFDAPPSIDFKTNRDRFILLTLYTIGLRRAELLNLKLADISRDVIRIYGKGGKERAVPLTPVWQLEFKPYLRLRSEFLNGIESPYVFVRADGRPLYPKYVYNTVRSYLQGIPQLRKKSPHVLRHSLQRI